MVLSIHHHHLVLAHRRIWIRMSVKIEKCRMVLMKAFTWEQEKTSKRSKDLILSKKPLMLVRKPDVRCKNLKKAREWETMDFGRFAFGNFTISICFWVVTCLYLAMRSMLQSACTFGMFQDRLLH
uniref:Transmembrane protein n=1 Tax=Arundo donax TaxID=35708 RepID=A0A0A9CMC7_ARUDO